MELHASNHNPALALGVTDKSFVSITIISLISFLLLIILPMISESLISISIILPIIGPPIKKENKPASKFNFSLEYTNYKILRALGQ